MKSHRIIKEKATKCSICVGNSKHSLTNDHEFAIDKFQIDGPTERLAYDWLSFSKSPALRQICGCHCDQKWCLKDPNERKGDKLNPLNWLTCSHWLIIQNSRWWGMSKLCIKIENDSGELIVDPFSKSHNNHDMLMLFCLERV